jgi:hypothetical protein
MTPLEAAKVLDLPEGADDTQVRERFLTVRAELEKKIAEALTPGLQERYRRALATTTQAYETLVVAAEKSGVPGVEGDPLAPACGTETTPRQTPGAVQPAVTFWQRAGWQLKGMIRGAGGALFGTACLAFYNSATAGTIFGVPQNDDRVGFIWLVGILGFIVWPGLLIWHGSVKASARLPFSKGKAGSLVLGFITELPI